MAPFFAWGWLNCSHSRSRRSSEMARPNRVRAVPVADIHVMRSCSTSTEVSTVTTGTR